MSAADFATVYDEQVWRVYAFFAYRTRSPADAEDLTQVTFEKALRAWTRYDSRRAATSTWLLAIARNVLTDHHRASGRDRTTVPLDETAAERLAAPRDRHRLGLDPSLERALEELNPREQELIGLRFGWDLTGPEIAEVTGLTLANVQQILSRALRRMRAALDSAATLEVV